MLTDLRDRHVLLVDDIFDTGNTLLEVISQLDGLALSGRVDVLHEPMLSEDRLRTDLRQ